MKSKIQRLMALVMALALVLAGAAEALADSEVKAGTINLALSFIRTLTVSLLLSQAGNKI